MGEWANGRMGEVTVEELIDRAAELVDRAHAGEQFTITRSGRGVAELRAVRREPTNAATLIARWSTLPKIDPDELRADHEIFFNSTWRESSRSWMSAQPAVKLPNIEGRAPHAVLLAVAGMGRRPEK